MEFLTNQEAITSKDIDRLKKYYKELADLRGTLVGQLYPSIVTDEMHGILHRIRELEIEKQTDNNTPTQ